MRPPHWIRTIWCLLVGACWIVACQTPTPAVVPTPTTAATISATHTIAAPTVTMTPTAAIRPTPTLAALDANTRERIFVTVWTAVADHYVYQDFRGVDWDAAYDTFLPQVRDARTPEAFYTLMRKLIDSLGDEHTRFDDPQDAAMNDAVYSGHADYAGIGIMVRELADGLMITRIAKDGPAAQAGLRPYDIITAVDNTAITAAYMRENSDYGSLIRGAVGSTVVIEYTRDNRQHQRVTVTRDVIKGDAFPEAVAQRGDDGVIILTIDSFDRERLADIVSTALMTAMGLDDVAGLIIDIRENGGGSIEDMLAVMALFHNGGSIGTQVDRNNTYTLNIPIKRVLPPFDNVPIVLLTSRDTASAAEMFSAGMRHVRHATIIGETTAGNSENLFPYDLEDGSVLWLAELLYRQPDGNYIEDVGVAPDIVLTHAWDGINASDDPFIAAAIAHIKTAHPTP